MELPPPPMESQPAAPHPPAMSLIARFSNIIAAPSEVFDDVKASTASTANWLAPTLILIFISWVATAIVFNTPTIQQQLRDITEQAIQKNPALSNLPQEKMEQAKEAALNMARISQTVGAYVGIPIIVFFSTFFWGLVIWLLGAKAFNGNFPFMKAVEAAGLANVIIILDSIIRTLLILVMGNLFAAPSLMLLVKGFDPQNTLHGMLGAIEVFTLWRLGVLAVGLSRLSGASAAKAAAWVFGIWVSYTSFFIGVGALFKAVMAHIGQPH